MFQALISRLVAAADTGGDIAPQTAFLMLLSALAALRRKLQMFSRIRAMVPDGLGRTAGTRSKPGISSSSICRFLAFFLVGDYVILKVEARDLAEIIFMFTETRQESLRF